MGIKFIYAIRIFLLGVLLIFPWKAIGAPDRFMEEGHARIVFSPNLEAMAEEVGQIVPQVKEELQRIFGWELQ